MSRGNGTWIIVRGPEEARGASHVKGPTTKGPTHVVSEAAVRKLLVEHFHYEGELLEEALECVRRYSRNG